MPKEPWWGSLQGKRLFGAPKWTDAQFNLTDSGMSRRWFCKAMLAGAAGIKSGSLVAANINSPHQAFSSSFLDVPESFAPTTVKFDKRLPDDLRGTLYRNGSARMRRDGTSYHHWFDGDGMIHSFDLQADAVTHRHRGRMIKTDRSIAEEKAARFL